MSRFYGVSSLVYILGGVSSSKILSTFVAVWLYYSLIFFDLSLSSYACYLIFLNFSSYFFLFYSICLFLFWMSFLKWSSHFLCLSRIYKFCSYVKINVTFWWDVQCTLLFYRHQTQLLVRDNSATEWFLDRWTDCLVGSTAQHDSLVVVDPIISSLFHYTFF